MSKRRGSISLKNEATVTDLHRKLAGHRNPWSSGLLKRSDFFTPFEEILLEAVAGQPAGVNMPTTRPQTATMRKKIRPSSAGPNLQSHPCYSTSLFDSNRPSTASSSSLRTQEKGALPVRPVTQAGPRRQYRAPQADVRLQEIQKQPRRLTLGTVDGLQPDLIKNRPRSGNGQISDQLKNKIEEQIDLNTLEELKKAFLRADRDESGQLDLEEFKALLKARLNLRVTKEAQIEALFKKIDWSYNGGITWDEFCTYMQLEYAEKEDSYLRSKEVEFLLPAKITSPPHRDPILRMTSNTDGSFLACSQDGTVTFWGMSGNELKWKRKKEIVNTETMSRTKPKWITDFAIMPEYNKFIVGTGDREIQFFELSSFDPYCQVSSLESVPLQLDYCATNTDECIIVFGDSQGCINILVIKNPGESLRLWKKEKRHQGFIPSISLDQIIEKHRAMFIRWQVHKDWVQQLKYYHDIKMIISCSNDRDTALVKGCIMGSSHRSQEIAEYQQSMIRQQNAGKKDSKDPQDKAKLRQMLAVPKPRQSSDQAVFQVYKGVKCFDFCKDKNIIVTGGMDRIVRLWNPYVNLKPTAMLRGHNAPIFYLMIAKEENRIFSISTDRCIKIWDIQDHNCLMTVREKGHAIRGDIQACHYSIISKSLAIATDNMCLLQLRQKPTLHRDITVTHKEPVTCCKYNACFNYVITCSEGSVIKIWDFETGTAIFEYGEAHGDSAITCMTFDNTERRLITGARDGVLNIWNYNNGHCLRKLQKSKGNDEICDVVYVEMNKNRYIISVGWDKRINIYSDSQTDSNIHQVQHPNIVWADDLKNGHKEDILSIAQCQPNLLATAGYDGEIVVWNMVSGHIFCKLHGKSSVSKLVFMSERAYNKGAASLISNGPDGHILFWKVFEGGSLLADFPGTSTEGALISTMTINEANTMLCVADNLGFVFVYNVDGYALSGYEEEPPELVNTWRGHVDSISCIELVEKNKVIMTASIDCTVRLWNYEGNYIGTFGQPEQWDLYNTSTFCHPMVPYDVLIDPMSLPSHPVLKEGSKTDDLLEEIKKKEDETSGSSWHKSSFCFYAKIQPAYTSYAKPQINIDDETIARDIKDLNGILKDTGLDEEQAKNYHGKWLRHEKTKIKKIDKGGPSDYQTLKWSQIVDPPNPDFPKVKFDKDDPFGSGMDPEMMTNSLKSFTNKQQAVS
ncbi:cilia- and flagella-associated protein 337-like isoform X4 [Mytilus galloprovincialis]|uniref:cilia- and flagella-associated protein 337-like isoform X4 n=1 Tax=Mytilus galloprovincialis TaxID=29158 RepID=UPI003F7B6DCC